MRRSHPLASLSLAATLGFGLFATLDAVAQEHGLDTVEKKIGYAVGLNFGSQLRQQDMTEVDRDALMQGILDGMAGADPAVPVEEMRGAFEEFAAKRQAAQAAAGAAALVRGQEFLAQNKTADGVAELEGGVQYKVVTAGDGPKPAAGEQVVVHYRGALLDGTEFDSSYARGEPVTFGLDAVIEGWRIAVSQMPVGSKWMVWIPSDKAYGERGAGGDIGPNETLQFEIELLQIADE